MKYTIIEYSEKIPLYDDSYTFCSHNNDKNDLVSYNISNVYLWKTSNSLKLFEDHFIQAVTLSFTLSLSIKTFSYKLFQMCYDMKTKQHSCDW